MIAEVGCVEVGAPPGLSKAAWIHSMLQSELVTHFPRVLAFVWFDQDNRNGQDFRIGSSAASQSAFRAGIQSSSYVSSFHPN